MHRTTLQPIQEFQKLGTKRYQSDKLSFEFKIIILETLILNSRTKSDSTAVLSGYFPSECVRSICVCGMALELFPAPGLSSEVWQSVLGCCCCCCCAQHTAGPWWVLSVSPAPQLCQAEPSCACWRKGEGAFPFRAEHPLLCLCCFCCLSSQPRAWS